jgi:uncharacterized SAM-binding protein YcdF (DUF218 family)
VSDATRRWARRLAIAGGVVVLAFGAYYLVTLYQVWATGRTDQARPVDAIVVLGAAQYDGTPSPQLQARLDQALELYRAGDAPLVVVTGGNQPGDRFTEAEASAAYLVERGVPEDAILQEGEGASTWESLDGVADLLEPLDLHEVLLVSDPFHLLRSRLIAEEVGLEAYTSPSSGGPVQGAENVVKHLKEAAGISLGRIIGFERLWGITG